MASDVEEETFVGDGPADSADIMLVLFDDEHVMAGLGEIVGGRQPGGTGSDNQSVDRLPSCPPSWIFGTEENS